MYAARAFSSHNPLNKKEEELYCVHAHERRNVISSLRAYSNHFVISVANVKMQTRLPL